MLPFLSRAVGPQGKVIAEDIFDDFLEGARQRSRAAKLGNVTFVKGTRDRSESAGRPARPGAGARRLSPFRLSGERCWPRFTKALKPDGRLVIVEYYKRPEAMPNGRAMTHIRLDMPDVIKEIEANQFHLVMEKETIKNVQYMLVLEKKSKQNEEVFAVSSRGGAAAGAVVLPLGAQQSDDGITRQQADEIINELRQIRQLLQQQAARSNAAARAGQPSRAPTRAKLNLDGIPDAGREDGAADDGGVHRLPVPVLPALPHHDRSPS